MINNHGSIFFFFFNFWHLEEVLFYLILIRKQFISNILTIILYEQDFQFHFGLGSNDVIFPVRILLRFRSRFLRSDIIRSPVALQSPTIRRKIEIEIGEIRTQAARSP